jgi:hypothetical protein
MAEGQSMTTVADVVAQVRDGRLEAAKSPPNRARKMKPPDYLADPRADPPLAAAQPPA